MLTINPSLSEESKYLKEVWKVLKSIPDPEIPVLSLIDLGIIRNVEVRKTNEKKEVEITVTPTYSGCPAMDLIAMQIRIALIERGFSKVDIKTVLSPAWTTEWMPAEAKKRLLDYGIAPPAEKAQCCAASEINEQIAVQCPQCKSYNTALISRFGSTACKALYKCNNCLEPFDHFKCH